MIPQKTKTWTRHSSPAQMHPVWTAANATHQFMAVCQVYGCVSSTPSPLQSAPPPRVAILGSHGVSRVSILRSPSRALAACPLPPVQAAVQPGRRGGGGVPGPHQEDRPAARQRDADAVHRGAGVQGGAEGQGGRATHPVHPKVGCCVFFKKTQIMYVIVEIVRSGHKLPKMPLKVWANSFSRIFFLEGHSQIFVTESPTC